MGKDAPQDRENKVSRPSAVFMINRTQLKPKIVIFLEVPIKYVRKLNYTFIYT